MKLPRYISETRPQFATPAPASEAAGAAAKGGALAESAGVMGEFAARMYEAEEAVKGEELLAEAARRAAELQQMEGTPEQLEEATQEFVGSLDASEVGVRSFRQKIEGQLKDLAAGVVLDTADRVRKVRIREGQGAVLRAEAAYLEMGTPESFEALQALWANPATQALFTADQVASHREAAIANGKLAVVRNESGKSLSEALLKNDRNVILDDMRSAQESGNQEMVNALEQRLTEYGKITYQQEREQEAAFIELTNQHELLAMQSGLSVGTINATTYSDDPVTNQRRKAGLRVMVMREQLAQVGKVDIGAALDAGVTISNSGDKRLLDGVLQERTAEMDQTDANVYITQVARSQGYITDSWTGNLKRGARGVNMDEPGKVPDSTARQVEFYATLTNARNGAPGADTGLDAEETAFYETAARYVEYNDTPAVAASKAWQAVFDVNEDQRRAREVNWDEDGPDQSQDAFDDAIDDLPGQPMFWGSLDAEDTWLETSPGQAWHFQYKQAYDRTGSWDSAERQATNWLKRHYRVTTANSSVDGRPKRQLLKDGPQDDDEADRWRGQLASDTADRQYWHRNESGDPTFGKVPAEQIELVDPIGDSGKFRLRYRGEFLQNDDGTMETFYYDAPQSAVTTQLDELEQRAVELSEQTSKRVFVKGLDEELKLVEEQIGRLQGQQSGP